MAANFCIIFEYLLNEALLVEQIRCAQCQAGVTGDQFIAQRSHTALEFDQAIPVVGLGGIDHALRQSTDFFVKLDLRCHVQMVTAWRAACCEKLRQDRQLFPFKWAVDNFLARPVSDGPACFKIQAGDAQISKGRKT